MNNLLVVIDDISNAECDIIVNASNGVGYMGGKASVKRRMKGVAESLNYVTGGKLEKVSLQTARRNSKISSWIYGINKGGFFVTDSCGLKCKKVFHAVTMRYPACRSDIKTIKKLLHSLAMWCREKQYKTVALPLLGCGNGNIDVVLVEIEIGKMACEFADLQFCLYVKNKKE